MTTPLEVKTPSAVLIYEWDWSEVVPANATIESVRYGGDIGGALTLIDQQLDAPGLNSITRIGGGVHGGIYVCKASAHLSTGEDVPAQFTLRVMSDATADA